MTAGLWAVLIATAAVAGWVDAVIGGGGLILIPMIMAVQPQLAPVTVLGSNKIAAISGTTSAAITLAVKTRPPLSLIACYAPVAVVCSGLGALVASSVDKHVMRPVIIVLMVAVGIFVAFKPSFGTGGSAAVPTGWRRWLTVGLVAVVSSYDGIFGPGTGMFLIMVFTAVLSQNFISSAALAKVVNVCTNFGALLVFAASGDMWWTLGLVLGVANIAGAVVGSKTVLTGGTTFIRYALLALVVVMGSYLGWLQYQGQ